MERLLDELGEHAPALVRGDCGYGNQTTLDLTPMHADTGLIRSMLANVQAAIRYDKAAAQQLPGLDRWRTLLAYICHRTVGQSALPMPMPMPPPALALAPAG